MGASSRRPWNVTQPKTSHARKLLVFSGFAASPPLSKARLEGYARAETIGNAAIPLPANVAGAVR
jgi:hypothetical protein